MNKATILRALHRQLIVDEVVLSMLKTSLGNLWEKCDPDKPETLSFYKQFNKERNRVRNKKKQINKLREAIKQVKAL